MANFSALVTRLPGTLALAAALALASPTRAQTITYAYTGGPQTYTVPAGVTAVRVVAAGASGGVYAGSNYGYGARAQATLAVTPGEVLTVQVGGQGSSNATPVASGYNGGGTGNQEGGGGGASDVRRAAAVGSTGDYLSSRNALLVAGGGGGSGNAPATGGNGGTPTGGNGSPYNNDNSSNEGGGASQSGPGSGGSNGGNPGSNGTGGAGRAGYFSAGGGGGYYGGGGSILLAGGGGGSSWVMPTGSTGISYAVAAAPGNGVVSITPLPTSFTYTAPGGPQTYVVPAGVTAVQVVATGASGGASGSNYSYGALVQTTLAVTPGEVLTVVVGGQGGSSGSFPAGGYNGGGATAHTGTGGGASEVRRASAAGSTSDYLGSRNALLVAGGGGGSGTAPATGGNGGTPNGAPGLPTSATYASGVGGGATQAGPGSGGLNSSANGVAGSNGNGGSGSYIGGGGGGGGYYGGGGGAWPAGGGGGSSWVTPTGSSGTSYGLAPAVDNGSVTILPLTTAFAYTGGPQTYVVPAGVLAVRVAATGASGGSYDGGGNYGPGARVQTTVLATPGEVLTVNVGGQGGSGAPGSGTVAGGYNGGGSGRLLGAGGGASDVRRASAAGSTGDYLATRNALVVAGGGGGSGIAPATGGSGGGPGGSAGSPYDAANAPNVGGGASPTGPGSGGGSSGAYPGAAGSGSSGGAANTSAYGCGGGGGYYGGGASTFDAGGGGGASWVMPLASAGTSYGLAPAAGDGAVTITPLPLTDLVVSATTFIPAALYNSITVLAGVGVLTGNTGVAASTTVQSGAVLADNCNVLSGPGSFTLAAGGTLGICAAQGISSSGSTGSIQVTGFRTFDPDATYVYNGTAAQVTGSGLPATVRSLVLNNGTGLTLTGPVTASAGVSLTTGVLATGSSPLTLGPAATLGETATGYATGTVQATRLLGTAGTLESFGGLGVTLLPSGSTLPGSTLVVRTTGTARTGAGSSQSVKRVFDIQPTTRAGLNVALTLTVRDDERNGIVPANLRLFKSENAGGSWQQQGATVAAITTGGVPTYTASLGGIGDFSLWTLGDATNPLPVQLVQFTARAAGPAAVQLSWTTASEVNSARFEVERSLDGVAYARVGAVAAAGRSATTRAYAYLDEAAPAGQLYYRLRQVDQDGSSAYSPVQTVRLGAGGLALAPNPAPHGAATLTGAAPRTAVWVLDALGRVAATTTTDATGTAALAGLAPGLYLVRAGTGSVRLAVE